jgi:hypothetical protein
VNVLLGLTCPCGSHILLMGAYVSNALSTEFSPRPMMEARAEGSVTSTTSCQRNLNLLMPPKVSLQFRNCGTKVVGVHNIETSSNP